MVDIANPVYIFEIFADSPTPFTVSPAGRQVNQQINQQLLDRVISFEFIDESDKMDKLTIKFDNRDFALFDSAFFTLGNPIRFDFGYAGLTFGPRQHFLSSLAGSEVLTLIAVEDQHFAMNQPRVENHRTFINANVVDVVTQIAREYGFTDTIIQRRTPFKITIPQRGRTDWQFLKDLADEQDYVFFIEDLTFHFHEKNIARMVNDQILRIKYFEPTSGLGDIKKWKLDYNILGVVPEYSVVGLDSMTKKKIEEIGSNEKTERIVDGSRTLIVDLEKAARTSGIPRPKISRRRIASAASSVGEARLEVDAAFNRANRDVMKLGLEVVGDPRLKAKRSIVIDGIGRKYSGTWWIKSHTHRLGPNGYDGKVVLDRNAAEDPVLPPVDRGQLNDLNRRIKNFAARLLENPPENVKNTVVHRKPKPFTPGFPETWDLDKLSGF